MGLFNPSWFCAHACLGPSMPDKVRKSVISNDGAIVGLKLKGNLGTGTGILIHRMLVLTTHGTLPSIAAALDADLLIKHNVQDSGNIRKRLAPDRFFITSPALGITVVACDWINTEALQPLFLDNANDPCLGCGRRIYLLGRHQNQQQNDLMVGDGRITAETETLIEFCADGTIWSPGSAGFDIWGNLAIMICDPKEHHVGHQMAPRKGNSFAWRKNKPKQFGITVSMIRKWLEENWNGGIEELGEPRISSTLEVESDREENTEISMNSAEPIGIRESKEQEQELSCISSCGQQQLDSSNTETEDILERREDEQNLQTASNIAAHQMQPRKQHLEKTRTVPTQNGRTKEEFIDTLSPIAEQKSINQEDFRNITSHIPVQLSKEEETNIFPAHCWRSHHGLNESSSITPLQSRNQQCVNVTVIQAEQRCNGRDRENLDRSTTPPCPNVATLEILERSSTTERRWESQKEEEDSDESSTNHADYLTYQEKSRHILSESGNKPDLKVPDLHPGHSRRNQQHVVGPSTPARKREPQLDILDRLNANAKQWELQEEDQKEDEDKENFFLTSSNFAAELRRLQEEQFQDQSNIFSQQIQEAQKMECCDVPLQKEEAQKERDESSILGLQELGTENFHLETSCKYKEFQNPKDPNVHECIIPEQCGVSQDVASQNEEESSTSKAILKKNVQEPFIQGSPSKQIEDDDLSPTEHFTDQSTIASLQNKKTQCEEGVDVQRSGVFLQPMKCDLEEFTIPASCKGLPKEKEQKPCSPNNHAEQNGIQQKSHGSRISALQNEGRRQKDLERSMILAQFKDPKWEMTPDPDMPSTPPQIEGKKDLQRATSLTRVRDDPKWEMELALDVPAIPAELKGQEELLTQEQFSSDQDSLNKSYELEVMEELADEMEGVLRAKAPDRLDDRQGMPDAAVVYMEAKAKKQEQVAEQGVKENEARFTGVDNSTENWTKWAESRHLDSYRMKKQKDLIGKTETSTSEQSEPPQMEVLPAPQISHPSIHNDKSPFTERVSHDEDHNSSPKQQSCRPSRGLLAIRQPLYVHAKYESEDCFSKASTDSDTESLNKENRVSQLGTLNQASSSSSCCSRNPETSDAETTSSVETRESVNSSPRERCPKKNLQRGHTQSSRGAANSGQPRIRSALTSCNSQMHPTCVRSLRGQNPSSSMRTSAECFVPIAPSRIKNRNLDETNVKKSAALVSSRWML